MAALKEHVLKMYIDTVSAACVVNGKNGECYTFCKLISGTLLCNIVTVMLGCYCLQTKLQGVDSEQDG